MHDLSKHLQIILNNVTSSLFSKCGVLMTLCLKCLAGCLEVTKFEVPSHCYVHFSY